MSTPSWQAWLAPLRPRPGSDPVRVALVGIGNELNGDDAAGLLVARLLSRRECAGDAPHLLVVEGGSAPENCTAALRRFAPQVVILVDAAWMDMEPGQVSLIPWETASGLSASTHSLPLSMLARYLMLEFNCSVHLLGIQAGATQPGSQPCEAVLRSARQVAEAFCETLLSPAPEFAA